MTSPEFPLLPSTSPTPTTQIKRVYLIRHGETDANATGIMQGSGVNLPLSEKGKQQAFLLGNRFEHTPVDVIVVSTLRRTTETAMYIKKFHPNARIVELKELVEISWGELEAKPPTKHITDLWRDWENGVFDAAAPGGESPIEVERRAVPALYNVIRNSLPEEKHIAIVIHGRLIRIILASILRNDLSYMNTFHHANTCVNVLDVAILDESGAKDAELKRHFVSGVTTRVNKSSAAMIDAVGSHLPTTPSVSRINTPQISTDTVALNNPEDIVFRGVVLNDCAHLANL
ncbi:UNVERIFIED_CONTAM: hypothetical protein HDU68_012095 [Siphonaria sp. JEL0065]|nr:hypothetical protein HDU68_012095 [Siphonaria sp. JEL0065]